MSSRPFFVIGNGPSLRGFDLQRLSAFETLGMNAAYRHWDRINWYPTHYCCLDGELIATHHEEIKRLVLRGQVRTAFVAGNFFELHPELRRDARFVSFDQVSPHWHRRRGKGFGLPPIKHPAFTTSDSSKVTTGAFAVRYAAYLGHDLIATLGIDLKYVEIIAEAEQGEGIALVIKETPKHNPNYFFDDYQQAGDRYNIPNPEVHTEELHPASFRVLRQDFQSAVPNCRVVNCNPTSVLNEMAIFPYASVETLLGETKLGAIAVPCHAGEFAQILANIRLWAQPAFAPYVGKVPANRPKLVFVFNNDDVSGKLDEIKGAIENVDLARFFSSVEYKFLNLRGEADAYVRTYDRPAGQGGYKAGPNNQFFDTLDLLKEDYGRYVFLMETDCVPIRPDWLRRLCEIVDGAEPFWIMGSAYRGNALIANHFARHINGNAIYAAGDPSFRSFVETVWRPGLDSIITGTDRNLAFDASIAYDCALEYMFSGARSDVEGDAKWKAWQSAAHMMRYTAAIQNISASLDLAEVDPAMVRTILRQSPETIVIHSQAVAAAVRVLLAASVMAEPTTLEPRSKDAAAAAEQQEFSGFHFVSIFPSGGVDRNEDQFIISPGIDANHVSCRYVGVIKIGDSVRATAEIEVEEPTEVIATFCRDGNTAWESTQKVFTLAEGRHSISMEHTFRKAHVGARIQFATSERPITIRIHESAIQLAG